MFGAPVLAECCYLLYGLLQPIITKELVSYLRKSKEIISLANELVVSSDKCVSFFNVVYSKT